MNQFETICQHLTTLDYYPHLHRRKTDWQCELYTGRLKTVPSGTGATALDALLAADAERKRVEKDPAYRMAHA